MYEVRTFRQWLDFTLSPRSHPICFRPACHARSRPAATHHARRAGNAVLIGNTPPQLSYLLTVGSRLIPSTSARTTACRNRASRLHARWSRRVLCNLIFRVNVDSRAGAWASTAEVVDATNEGWSTTRRDADSAGRRNSITRRRQLLRPRSFSTAVSAPVGCRRRKPVIESTTMWRVKGRHDVPADS